MKKIFCPKCDTAIPVTKERIAELKEQAIERFSIVCPSCAHQLRLKLRPAGKEQKSKSEKKPSCGHLIVIENVFGYKQLFPLQLGLNRIGRRNKDTVTDIPIITADPSMDRHHALIKVTETKDGSLRFALSDNDSHVGTFVAGRILEPKEWLYLESGDVITLGATSIIFNDSPLPEEESLEEEATN